MQQTINMQVDDVSWQGKGVISGCKDHKRSRFPHSIELNHKVLLWVGQLCELKVDAIVHSTNERLTESNHLVHEYGGAELIRGCGTAETCSTGEVVVTTGGNLYSNHVIHTVAPLYKPKYDNAAQHSLHSCYRKSLYTAVKLGARSIAFPIVHLARKGHPMKRAAHIAVRTVRRFLEAHGTSMDKIVFVMNSRDEFEVYSQVIPLYFPRTCDEEIFAEKNLPENVGDAIGDTFDEARRIRIEPRVTTGHSVDLSGAPDFCAMLEGPDERRKRLEGEAAFTMDTLKQKLTYGKRKYDELLARSENTGLGEIAKLNFLYHSGYDELGRPVIVFIARQFLTAEIEDQDLVLMYIIRTLHRLVQNEYVFVYVNTNTTEATKLGRQWLQELYLTLPRTYGLVYLILTHSLIDTTII